jgi:type I restriction enzyme S subunit
LKEYDTVKLGTVIELDLVKVPISPTETYPMVGVYSFGRGLFDREPVHGNSTSYKFFYLLKPNHIVMSQLFGWEGALALSSKKFEGKYLSPQFPTFLADEKKLDRQFLGWIFKIPSFWDKLGTKTRGMGDRRRTLNPQALLSMKIPLPPIFEQHRIAAKIKRLSAKIEEVRRLRVLTDELVKSFVVSLNAKLSGQSISEIGSFLELDENRCRVEPDEYYPQVGIRGFGGGLFPKPKLRGSETSYRYFNRLQTGQIVLSQVKGWEGAIAVCPQELDGFYVSPEYRTFACKQDTSDTEYLDHLFRTPWFHKMLANATRGQGARRERTRPELFLAIKLPMPSYDMQVRAAKLVKNMSKIPTIHNQTEAKFSALLPSILDKAFRGEL